VILNGVVELVQGYAYVKGVGLVAVLSEDVGGLTYVARWVRTDLLEPPPHNATKDNTEETSK
jgi:hypothetical protein